MPQPTHKFEWRVCPFTAKWSEGKRLACFGCMRRGCARFRELGLDEQGQPLPVSKRPKCGADGKCRNPVEPGKRRCRLHGGASTGPKTAEGRARIAAAQKARWEEARKRTFSWTVDGPPSPAEEPFSWTVPFKQRKLADDP
jgi:hypothetical protein